MAIRGLVYNVTPYMEYHPGGRAQLMRGAGMDATRLFDEARAWCRGYPAASCSASALSPVSPPFYQTKQVHAWVNVQGMLDKCCIGRLVGGAPSTTASGLGASLLPPAAPKSLGTSGAASLGGFARPNVPAQADSQTLANTPAGVKVTDTSAPAYTRTEKAPKTDWFQSSKKISLIYYVKNLSGPECVSATVEATSAQVAIYGPDFTFEQLVRLGGRVDPTETKVSVSALCVTVSISKLPAEGQEKPPQWDSAGKTVWERFSPVERASAALDFRPTRVLSRKELNHDTILLRIKAGFDVPPGCHVRLRVGPHVRPYTPVVGLTEGDVEDEGVSRMLIKVRRRGLQAGAGAGWR